MLQAPITGAQNLWMRISKYFSPLLAAWTFVFAATATPVLAGDLQLSLVRRTTIARVDPETSLRFYRDLLGFTVEYDVVARLLQPLQFAFALHNILIVPLNVACLRQPALQAF